MTSSYTELFTSDKIITSNDTDVLCCAVQLPLYDIGAVTDKTMTTKLKSVRAGHRSAISRNLKKFDNLKENPETDIDEITGILNGVLLKQKLLENLNQQIMDEMTEEDDIESEILDTDEYTLDLNFKITKIKKWLTKSKTPLNPNAPAFNVQNNAAQFENQPDMLANSCENMSIPAFSNFNSQENHLGSNVTASFSQHFHKLPKLNLPTFDGDVLEWQAFWDSYETSVHTNPTLSNVQRFNYLKSLLRNEALQSITGFPLTNLNYEKAISLLRERYGQETKIVQTYMQALIDLAPPSNTLVSLRCFYDQNETYIRGLESLGQMCESNNSLLVPVILNKLPGEIRKNLVREHGSNTWSLIDLRKGLNNELRIMEAGSGNDIVERIPTTAAFFTRSSKKSSSIQRNKSCVFCDGAHFSANCTKVIDADSRVAVVKKKSLCFNCLGNHKRVHCKSKHACKICQKYHHTSLCTTKPNGQENAQNETVKHNAKTETTLKQTETAQQVTPQQISSLHSSTESRENVLLKTAVTPVSFKTQCVDANILFDEGSQRSFITEALATELDLKPLKIEMIQLSAFGDKNQRVRSMQTSRIYVHAENGTKIPVDVLIVPEIAADLKTHNKDVSSIKHLQGLKLAHPSLRDENFTISILIGADFYWDIVEDHVIRGNGPTAVKSKVGYLLSGPILNKKIKSKASTSVLNVMAMHKNEQIDLEKFWKLESMGIENVEIAKETEKNTYSKHYEESSISYRDNRYHAKLPWKDDHQPLPTNENIARNRTENVIKRLSREPTLLSKYGEIIAEQEKRGFIEKVSGNTNTNESAKIHYIPHHAVKKDSTTTPIRIVYDCSCKQNANSPSLNDCLSSEPPVLNDLTGILVRFRLEPYAVSTDIEKAFLNVGLELEDRDATRFFWLRGPADPSSPLEENRF